MTVACPSCRARVSIPDARAANPNLKVKCRCGVVFALSEASLVLVAAPAPAPTPARPSAAAVAPPPAAEAAPAPAGPPPARSTARRGPVNWRRCRNHPETASVHVCPGCNRGYCAECAPLVNNVPVCSDCDRPCVPAEKHLELQERERHRARPLRADLGLIASYPFVDRWAYVLLALFTWFFGLMRGFSSMAVLLSEGVLISYTFQAVFKVSIGNLREFMPDFRDVGDLSRPLRLGLAALVMGTLPLFLVTVFLLPSKARVLSFGDAGKAASVVHADDPPPPPSAAPPEGEDDQEMFEKAQELQRGRQTGPPLEEGEERAAPAWAWALFVAALIWRVVYTPVALTVAAISRSFASTFNPVLGLSVIRRMGAIYWEVTAVYTVLSALEWGLGRGLSLLPVLGGLVMAFVRAWSALVTGCLLGLAVYKRGRELGWE